MIGGHVSQYRTPRSETDQLGMNVRHKSRKAGRTIIALLTMPLLLAGCNTMHTGSVGTHGGVQTSAPLSPEQAGQRYARNPTDLRAIIAFAEALRADNRTEQAVQVLRNGMLSNRGNKQIAAAYGKALAANGNLQQALNVVRNAQRRDLPDWRLLSAEGAILDQMNKHAEARKLYTQALKIQPNAPTTLNNFGLSYALTGDLQQAEHYLRLAIAQPGASPKVRENLSLVLGLQGKHDAAAANTVSG